MSLFKKNNKNFDEKLEQTKIVIKSNKSSMRHWLIVIVILVAVFLIVGFLSDQGYLNVKWQGLAMIIAAIAGPYKLLKNYINGGSKKTEKILDKHQKIEEEEKVHRVEYDQKIEEREKKIEKLDKEIDDLDKEIEKVEEKRKKVDKQTEKMSLDDLQNDFNDMYEDE